MGQYDPELAENLAALSRIIARITSRPGQATRQVATNTVDTMMLAQTIFLHRKRRHADFPEIREVLVEPAWDMLLILYVESKAPGVPVSTAISAAGVPHATGLRYLTILESRNFVESIVDTKNRRLRYVRLTPDTRRRMDGHFGKTSETIIESAKIATRDGFDDGMSSGGS